ncbi:MAG TPA: MFS transporter [Bacillales bacterium]|nr:MFS transporter [Bacillales bacterium]
MPKSFWLLIVGMTVNVAGASLLWPLNTIYIHGELGKSLALAGVALMFNAGAAIVGNLIGGSLFDSIGGYKAILAGIFLCTFAAGMLIFFHSWWFYIIFLVVLGFGSGMVRPSMFALAGSVWPEGGRKAFNAIYVAQNLGVAVGAAAGGWIASFSFQSVFTVNMAMYAIFLLIAYFGFRRFDGEGESAIAVGRPQSKSAGIRDRTRFTALMILSAVFFLCWMAYVQWQSTIAAYTQEIGISLNQYSLLWSVNGALIVLGQPLIAIVVKKVRSPKSQMTVGICIFIAAMAVAAGAEGFVGFLTAMIILTFGEMLVWPAVPTVAHEMAPTGRAGFYQGFVNSMKTAGKMAGPPLGGIIADLYGMPTLFSLFMVVFGFAIVAALFYDRPLKRSHTTSEAARSW